MRTRRCQPDLADDALSPCGITQPGSQHLERHISVLTQVARWMDCSHAADAEQRPDAVAVSQGGGEWFNVSCSHGRKNSGGHVQRKN